MIHNSLYLHKGNIGSNFLEDIFYDHSMENSLCRIFPEYKEQVQKIEEALQYYADEKQCKNAAQIMTDILERFEPSRPNFPLVAARTIRHYRILKYMKFDLTLPFLCTSTLRERLDDIPHFWEYPLEKIACLTMMGIPIIGEDWDFLFSFLRKTPPRNRHLRITELKEYALCEISCGIKTMSLFELEKYHQTIMQVLKQLKYYHKHKLLHEDTSHLTYIRNCFRIQIGTLKYAPIARVIIGLPPNGYFLGGMDRIQHALDESAPENMKKKIDAYLLSDENNQEGNIILQDIGWPCNRNMDDESIRKILHSLSHF